MAIDYTKYNPVNLILASMLTNITAAMGILINRMRESEPIQDMELILMALLLTFYLLFFIYRQMYYNNNPKPNPFKRKEVKGTHVQL